MGKRWTRQKGNFSKPGNTQKTVSVPRVSSAAVLVKPGANVLLIGPQNAEQQSKPATITKQGKPKRGLVRAWLIPSKDLDAFRETSKTRQVHRRAGSRNFLKTANGIGAVES